MLVILNTVEAIMKRYIASSLTNVLNPLDNHQIGEYSVDYTDAPYRIKNADGEVVYRAGDYRGKGGVGTLLNSDSNAMNVIKQATEYQEYLDTLNVKYHLANTYSDPYYELVGGDKPDFTEDISFLLDLYNERDLDTIVVSGGFSALFVKDLVTRLGSEVKIINVTRNPSVAYMMDASYLRTPLKTDAVSTFGNRLLSSMLNCAQLKALPDVTTVKFEDILTNGGFEFEGKFVPTPEYGNFNNIITKHEKLVTLVEEHNVPKRDDLHIVNQVLENHSSRYPDVSYIPNNMFTELGYTGPLTLSEMITPLADDANPQP